MMWNPTKNIYNSSFTQALHGGMHYVYVFGHNSDGNFNITSSSETIPSDIRRYDAGSSLYKMMRGSSTWVRNYPAMGSTKTAKWELLSEVFKDLMWVNIPVCINGFDIAKPSDIPCDVKVRIRVNKPYRYGLSTTTSVAHTSTTVATTSGLNLLHTKSPIDSVSLYDAPADVISNPVNGNFPMYSFNTNDLVPKDYDKNTAQNAMAKINVVPNPYYGHSAYEKTRIDNVKIGRAHV